MRAFLAPSILLSVVRRSSKGFAHGFQVSSATGTAAVCRGRSDGSVPRATSIAALCSSSSPTETDEIASPAVFPLGVDPENCKVADIRQQIRRRGYTVPSTVRTKAKLLEELGGLVRAESFAPPDPVTSEDGVVATGTSATPVVIAEGNIRERQRWSPKAGWVDRSTMERGKRGYPLCRFCNEEVPSVRRTFCSNGCVHEHKLRTQGAYVRKCLFTRDGGRCAECGLDAGGLYRRARAAWSSEDTLAAKRAAVALEMKGTIFEGKVPAKGATRRPTQGKFWHADHIVPVVRGGGQCSLNNYRTLCVRCHAQATKKLAGERAAERVKRPEAGIDGDAPAASSIPAGATGVAANPKPGRYKPTRETQDQMINNGGSGGTTSTSSSSCGGRSRGRRRAFGRISLADALSTKK